MTPQDAFHATCHAYPGGCESLAPRLGMTPAVLRNKAPSDLAVLELVTHVWRSHGNVGAAVDAALADNRIEGPEVEQIRAAIYTHIQALQQMLTRIEALQDPSREA